MVKEASTSPDQLTLSPLNAGTMLGTTQPG